jgi:hypothetical protein
MHAVNVAAVAVCDECAGSVLALLLALPAANNPSVQTKAAVVAIAFTDPPRRRPRELRRAGIRARPARM